MEDLDEQSPIYIVGASHAGVTCAFSLRSEGWTGRIILLDMDSCLPYHRPPLSKAFLIGNQTIGDFALKPLDAYKRENIELRLGVKVTGIDRESKSLYLSDGGRMVYGRLVLATGARPFIPPIAGLDKIPGVFSLRTAADIEGIRREAVSRKKCEVVIIGGGYIGLEAAASLSKLGAGVTLLEMDKRILSRVTSPFVSGYFHDLHQYHGVAIHTERQVTATERRDDRIVVRCANGSAYEADFLIVGAGIKVNTDLAAAAQLELDNGIRVDAAARTSDRHIFSIGDCTSHFNIHYGRYVRLECVQNATEQARVAASALCGKQAVYDALPWFWSDQYDVKLQIVGLSEGYDQAVVRCEDRDSFSVWYFNQGELLAVDAVNNPRAYITGTKAIRGRIQIDPIKLRDLSVQLKLDRLQV